MGRLVLQFNRLYLCEKRGCAVRMGSFPFGWNVADPNVADTSSQDAVVLPEQPQSRRSTVGLCSPFLSQKKARQAIWFCYLGNGAP